jgi:hypothetical protein
LGLNVAPGQLMAQLPPAISEHVEAMMHCPQRLAWSLLQEKPLDESAHADRTSHAVFWLGGGASLPHAIAERHPIRTGRAQMFMLRYYQSLTVAQTHRPLGSSSARLR